MHFAICHRFVGNKNYIIGNIFNGFNKKRNKFIKNNTVDKKQNCKKCWARYICGGGCYHNNFIDTGNENKALLIECENTKKRIKQNLKHYIHSKSGNNISLLNIKEKIER